jgi:transposase
MRKNSMAVAGIDTGKLKLDVAIEGSAARLEIVNDAGGHHELVAWLRRHHVGRIGIEASGGYERKVVQHLRAEGFTVIVLQPLQVRAYAQFRLRRAKNDRIDAALIAVCAAAVTEVRPAPDPRFAAFAEHLTLIEQIDDDIARYKTRREAFQDPQHRQRIEEEIVRLKAWRRRELKQLRILVTSHPDLDTRLQLIASVPGIGERSALALLIRMPELGSLSREQAAALAGLAPFDHDSGAHSGERSIAGGRKRLRKSLYAAALPAAFHWNKHLIALYRRLRAAGKPHKLALVACARKLLIFANTIVARGTPWTERAATI